MKNVEIERKFVILKDKMPDLSSMGFLDIEQGYLRGGSENTVRLEGLTKLFTLKI